MSELRAKPDTCPTCGGYVEVVNNDEGTSYYVPTKRGEGLGQQLLEAQEREERLGEYNDQLSMRVGLLMSLLPHERLDTYYERLNALAEVE